MFFPMGTDDICHAGLALGLGFPSATVELAQKTQLHKPIKAGAALAIAEIIEPSLTLALSGDGYVLGVPKKTDLATGNKVVAAIGDRSVGPAELYCRQMSPHSTVSSFSSPRVKRERDDPGWEEVEAERVWSKPGDDDDVEGVNARKKLRLTKEQSAILEERFKQHSTLNPKQKQALAGKLNLRPRQVEVWFQNRRARTKLKQTEVDCEFLKKCCETLTDENRRLQKELQELKSLKLAHRPFYMNVPAATLTVCPLCERAGATACDGGSKRPFPMAPKAHLYSPFSNHPSAAC